MNSLVHHVWVLHAFLLQGDDSEPFEAYTRMHSVVSGKCGFVQGGGKSWTGTHATVGRAEEAADGGAAVLRERGQRRNGLVLGSKRDTQNVGRF